MQVTPTSGGWSNPAAFSQQSINDSKHAGAASHKTTNPDAVDTLEQTEKTGDRDANERYFGQGPQNNKETPADDSESKSNAMLSLPAIDETAPSTLDLLG